jgi:ubiquinone/menaquinone biosynthesis C-methylase UbiE
VERVLETEVMDTAEEAREYDAMDHAEVNTRFVADLLAIGPIGPRVLDIGTGTALIPIELCTRAPNIHVVAIDLAEHMLAIGARNVARAGFSDRIMLERIDAKKLPYADGSFATTISNSIIHHIPSPAGVFSEIHRVTASGGLVFLRDLVRPPNDAEVDRLVATYGGDEPADPNMRASWGRQRGLLRDSLKAALTLDEVEALARGAGMTRASVTTTSDRHWTLVFKKQ